MLTVNNKILISCKTAPFTEQLISLLLRATDSSSGKKKTSLVIEPSQ